MRTEHLLMDIYFVGGVLNQTVLTILMGAMVDRKEIGIGKLP